MAVHGPRLVIGSGAALADVAVLRFCWIDPAELATQLSHPREWVAAAGADTATLELARVGLWLCAAWLVVAVLAVLGSDLPGTVGRAFSAVAGRAAPALVRRAVAAALGASVVLAPVAAAASTVGTPGESSSPTAAVTTAAVSPSAVPPTGAARAAAPSTAPTSIPIGSAAAGPVDVATLARPVVPVPWPRTATPGPGSGGAVVRPGDCLWVIAAHRLGPRASGHDIAAETGRWYRANAVVIGADPGLVHPGQHLQQPSEKGR